MRSTSGYRFNMFVMKRAQFNAYCAWLFDILFELERRLDISSYTTYDARVFGFVGERLLDVWLAGTPEGRGTRVAELPVLHLEGQRWPMKIARFLRRMFLRNAQGGKTGEIGMDREKPAYFDWRVIAGAIAAAVMLGVLNNLRVFEERRVEWFGGPLIGAMEE